MKTTANSEFTPDDGQILVQAVRQSIRSFFSSRRIVVPELVARDRRFDQNLGCFVTLKLNDDSKSLRGCIGFPEPIYKLSKAIATASVYAATQDPRFQPINSSELDSLLVEVSLLTTPEKIEATNRPDLLSKVRVGRDGLIMRWEFGSGLLLPQVARELDWNARQFLENLGIKAGARPDQWLQPGTQLYRFQAKVFEEISPKGPVVLADFHGTSN